MKSIDASPRGCLQSGEHVAKNSLARRVAPRPGVSHFMQSLCPESDVPSGHSGDEVPLIDRIREGKS